VTWTGIFENYPTASIGDLAIAPSDPKIVWVGTGEANIFRSSMAGIGIFKSVDAGQRFTYMGLADTQHISRILVHPTNPDIVYVASAGHEYTFSPDRGVYKTTDGGKTWDNPTIDFDKRMCDYIEGMTITLHPTKPGVLFFSTMTHGFFISRDAGKTWSASEPLKSPPFILCTRFYWDPEDPKTVYVATFGGGIWKGPDPAGD
jgi:hypothetical protein